MSDLSRQIEETKAIFKALNDDISREIKGGIIAAAMLVRDTSKKKFGGPNHRSKSYNPDDPTPHVDTGLLRKSIEYKLGDNGQSAQVGSSVEYAAKYEYGESIAVPHPFLNNSFEECKPKILEEFEIGFLKVLDARK